MPGKRATPKLETILVDCDQDQLPAITVGMYKRFLAQGPVGRTALAVYQHILFCYRVQGTDRPWATNKFLMAGLSMGRNKVAAARSLLQKMGLVVPWADRDEAGRVKKWYLRLTMLPNPGGKPVTATIPESGTVDAISSNGDPSTIPETPLVDSETQMLEEVREEMLGEGERTPAPSVSASPPDLKTEIAPGVFLSSSERRDLEEEFGVPSVAENITRLSCYLGNNVPSNHYSDHAKTLNRWCGDDRRKRMSEGIGPARGPALVIYKPEFCPKCHERVFSGCCLKCGWEKRHASAG